MTDRLHPADVGSRGRVGSDPIRKAATYAALNRMASTVPLKLLSAYPPKQPDHDPVDPASGR